MIKIAQLVGLMVILLLAGCSEDNSTSPSVSIIIGTWDNIENENDVITFYPDGHYVHNNSSGTYSYLESEKKGSLRKGEYVSVNSFIANFEIIDNLLYLGGNTFRK